MEIIEMPKLGESVHEGTIEEWLVSVGDTVSEYDPLCEVLTDKVTAEVPSLFDGVVKEILVEKGETVSVGTPILKIEVDGEQPSDDATDNEKEAEEKIIEEITESTETPSKEKKASESSVEKPSGMRISPVVMRLATENNIDLSDVIGTGALGRVTKKDIEKYIQDDGSKTNQTIEDVSPKEPADDKIVSKPKPVQDKGNNIPVTGVRKAIASKMVQSVNEIPHAWLMMEVDATNLVNLRNKHKESFKAQGVNLTYFTFFIDAVTKALEEYPLLNSTWQEDEILIHDDINISIAVASEENLYVPVIKNADNLSIKGMAKEVSNLAKLGRSNKLTQAHMSGGTFTVNNTGAFGSIQSMGIINHPQAAILQVESIVKKPVFIDDMLAARYMVNLCMSIDHRILDGLIAGKFLGRIKELIESIDPNQTSL